MGGGIMSKKKIEAAKGFVAALLAALVSSGVIDAGASRAVDGIVVAALALLAAFSVVPPRSI
jgi:uncharacterized membrane protein YccC